MTFIKVLLNSELIRTHSLNKIVRYFLKPSLSIHQFLLQCTQYCIAMSIRLIEGLICSMLVVVTQEKNIQVGPYQGWS